jgi:hypothetical protein
MSENTLGAQSWTLSAWCVEVGVELLHGAGFRCRANGIAGGIAGGQTGLNRSNDSLGIILLLDERDAIGNPKTPTPTAIARRQSP